MQQIHFGDGVTLIERALEIFPDSVAAYLASLLPDPSRSGGVMPVAVIAAVWSSSMGMLAIIKGLDQIFQVQETRGYVRLRIMACLLYTSTQNRSEAQRPSQNKIFSYSV